MFPFRVFQNISSKPQNSSSNPPRVPVQTAIQHNTLPYFSTGFLPARSFGTEIYSSHVENIQYKELHPFVYKRIEEDRLAKKQEREVLEEERRARMHDEEVEALKFQEVKVKESIELLQEGPVVPKLPENELKVLKEKTKQTEKKIKEELHKREYPEGISQQPF